MRTVLSIFLAAALCACFGAVALAQNAISAKAGMINVADGDVFMIDAKGGEPRKVEPKVSEFVDVKEGQTLRTADGRAEVLLTPGAFLRMADDSSFKLFSNRLTDVRLEALSGSLLIEATEMIDGNTITVLAKDATATITKGGLYRFESDPARIRVYLGEALIEQNGQKTTVKSGREFAANGNGWTLAKFDAKETDPLYRWSKRRSGYIAMANVSAARQSTSGGFGFNGSGRWYYNPYFGFATYVPWGDTLRSPFGYYYYTPSTVMAVYYPPRPAYGGGGMNGFRGMGGSGGFAAGMGSRSAGTSTYSPSAGVSAPSAASAPSMGAGSVGSRSAGAAAPSAPSGGGGVARGGRGN
jgi:hypothetical protein